MQGPCRGEGQVGALYMDLLLHVNGKTDRYNRKHYTCAILLAGDKSTVTMDETGYVLCHKTHNGPLWKKMLTPVTDSGFPRGRQPQREDTDLLYGIIFAKNCIKIKTEGGVHTPRPHTPPDP